MTEREVIAGVLGMVIGLASSMIGIVLQHILSLRADRIKREGELQYNPQLDGVKCCLLKESEGGRHG